MLQLYGRAWQDLHSHSNCAGTYSQDSGYKDMHSITMCMSYPILWEVYRLLKLNEMIEQSVSSLTDSKMDKDD